MMTWKIKVIYAVNGTTCVDELESNRRPILQIFPGGIGKVALGSHAGAREVLYSNVFKIERL